MKKKTNDKRRIKSTFRPHRKLDSHKWESKMEIHRLLSGKSDLKLKPDSKATV